MPSLKNRNGRGPTDTRLPLVNASQNLEVPKLISNTIWYVQEKRSKKPSNKQTNKPQMQLISPQDSNVLKRRHNIVNTCLQT